MADIQDYNSTPKFETFSYLPAMSPDKIRRQITYVLTTASGTHAYFCWRWRWSHCTKLSILLNTNVLSTGYRAATARLNTSHPAVTLNLGTGYARTA